MAALSALFWGFNALLHLIPEETIHPPLGLLTVAALSPKNWGLRLVKVLERICWRVASVGPLSGHHFIKYAQDVAIELEAELRKPAAEQPAGTFGPSFGSPGDAVASPGTLPS